MVVSYHHGGRPGDGLWSSVVGLDFWHIPMELFPGFFIVLHTGCFRLQVCRLHQKTTMSTKPKAKERRQRIARSIAGACRHRNERRKYKIEEAAQKDDGQSKKPPAGTNSNDDLAVFGDDVLLLILSFVSYAPYETEEIQWREPHPHLKGKANLTIGADHLRYYADYLKRKDTEGTGRTKLLKSKQNKKKNRHKGSLQVHSFGTLMHVLPLVCKRFHELCSGSAPDILWLQAIERLAANDEVGWCWPLWKLSHQSTDGEDTGVTGVLPECWSRQRISVMVDAVFSRYSTECVTAECTAKLFFQELANNIAEPRVFSGHLIHNKNLHPPKLGASYRLAISDMQSLDSIRWLMQHRPNEDLIGKEIDDDGGLRRRPRFLYNYGVDNAVAGDPVLLVEITRCRVEKRGATLLGESNRFHLTIVPIMHMRLSERLSSSIHVAFPRITDQAARTLQVARVLRPIHQSCEVDETENKKIVSAPMVRMFSTVAPQLGMEFLIEGIHQSLYRPLLDDMIEGRPPAHTNDEVIPHFSGQPRPTIIYTCQPDRWMPLGDGIPGEDAFVIEIRRVKINESNATFAVSGVPVQLGKLLGPTETNEASDLSLVSVKVKVVLGPFGPKLI